MRDPARHPEDRPSPDARVTDGLARPVRVLVVDDHPLTRTGVSAVLRQQPDIEVVGEAESAEAALTCVRGAAVDVAILDLRLGASRHDGLELAAALRETAPGVKVVLYSNYVSDVYATLLGSGNVFGMVLKTDHPRMLVEAVYSSARKIAFVSPEAAARMAGA